MGGIENVTHLAIATVLDPRFKKMHFTNPLACPSAVAKVKDLMKTTAQNQILRIILRNPKIIFVYVKLTIN